MDKPIEIFFSYAHKDEALVDEVRRQLSVYERKGRILKWHDREITAGTEWSSAIDENLDKADIILLFVSPDFLCSDYCYDIELKRAMERHEAGEARVIPIILRHCAWQETPFGRLQALPKDGVPITRWPDRDEACLNVVTGVMAAVEGRKITPKQSQFGLKTLRVFAKGHLTGWDTKLDVIWDGKVVAQGSYRKGFDVTIADVSNETHSLSVKYKGWSRPFKDQHCKIPPSNIPNTIELAYGGFNHQPSWKYVRDDD